MEQSNKFVWQQNLLSSWSLCACINFRHTAPSRFSFKNMDPLFEPWSTQDLTNCQQTAPPLEFLDSSPLTGRGTLLVGVVSRPAPADIFAKGVSIHDYIHMVPYEALISIQTANDSPLLSRGDFLPHLHHYRHSLCPEAF
eukprot:Gregarina_sp_Poly_1__1522@NODE_1382_length_4251_cov_27_651291_g926_i0_p3_GENE_NODE_1382_length_4251_cov_27_651291_g926_i0NODE_1382_length_4251_cov_27_651291_g926_i0_p3_ORF_typecomplete_len140_score6_99_NODE_1382_length_4251_cov_27_651291_g926_i0458877